MAVAVLIFREDQEALDRNAHLEDQEEQEDRQGKEGALDNKPFFLCSSAKASLKMKGWTAIAIVDGCKALLKIA